MNYRLLDQINKLNTEFVHRMDSLGKLINSTLLNINFTFTCDVGLNEKEEVFLPTEDVELAPIIDKKNRPNKSNRGKKTNKKLEKKMNKFGSNIKFKVYDEIYDKKFTVIVFRIQNGGIPGLVYNDSALVNRLITKVFNMINSQYPEKNFKYTGHNINLCNLKGNIILGPLNAYNKHNPKITKIINIYILRDIMHLIYNKEFDDFIMKKKQMQEVLDINESDKDLKFRDEFIDCLVKDSNVYLVIYYRVNNKIITSKLYNNGRIYIIGNKDILSNYDLLYNLKHIVYHYNEFILTDP